LQQVVQLVGVAWIGLGFAAHTRDRPRIEAPEFARFDRKPASHLDGACAALLERCVVQERIRPRNQNLHRQR